MDVLRHGDRLEHGAGRRSVENRGPPGSPGAAEEVASLASEASFLTGAGYLIDGSYTARSDRRIRKGVDATAARPIPFAAPISAFSFPCRS
jgi:hypothetical protein